MAVALMWIGSGYSSSSGLARLGEGDSVCPFDREFKRENAMDPFIAALVIVAIWTPIPICLSKWVQDL